MRCRCKILWVGVLLIHQPDGPLGGTFSGTYCPAQAWPPDFQQHAPGCPLCPPPLPMTGG